MSKQLKCDCCGKPTLEGQWQDRINYKKRPIWGTDFSKPVSHLVQGGIISIVKIRSQLNVLRELIPLLTQRLEPHVGLMTCSIMSLDNLMVELERYEQHCRDTGPSPYEPAILPDKAFTREERQSMADNATVDPWQGVDMDTPSSKLISAVRDNICAVRGTFSDLSRGTVFTDRFGDIQGALTVALSSLHTVMIEMEIMEAHAEALAIDIRLFGTIAQIHTTENMVIQ
jgi:hypothetical protein